MNVPLSKLSSSIISTLQLNASYTGKVRAQFEFRDGQIVQIRKLTGEQVVDLERMKRADNQHR